jgi:NAD-dependent deacetylase
MIDKAIEICMTADMLLIIGTSMQVYPAASLLHYRPANAPIFFIDPKPTIHSQQDVTVIAESATVGIKQFIELVKK